jgi:hypothetical protein
VLFKNLFDFPFFISSEQKPAFSQTQNYSKNATGVIISFKNKYQFAKFNKNLFFFIQTVVANSPNNFFKRGPIHHYERYIIPGAHSRKKKFLSAII